MAGNEPIKFMPLELALASLTTLIAIISIAVAFVPGMLAYVG